RPARLRDADFAGEALRAGELLQLRDAPGRAHALERRVAWLAVHHGDAGRIVAAVLEPLQPLDEDGNDVTPGYRTDDSAHVWPLFLCGLDRPLPAGNAHLFRPRKGEL